MADVAAPRETTVRRLFALSSNRCAFRGCHTPIVAADHNTILAEICHIRGRRPMALRYDPTQTPDERHGIANLVLLCGVHHKIIDDPDNIGEYTVEALTRLKAEHEAGARADVVADLSASLVRALINTAMDRTATTHMDFRGAEISAGGQGGLLGGGGGAGGTINIVGVTPAGFQGTVDASGKNATSFGGGGGGGGRTTFTGRPILPSDLAAGLRVSAFFMANTAEIRNGLLFVLGGGWESFTPSSVPGQASITILCVIDTGAVPPATLLALQIIAYDPSGRVVVRDGFDLAIDGEPRPLMRHVVRRVVSFEVAETQVGVWSFTLSSNELDLANVDVEMKAPPRP